MLRELNALSPVCLTFVSAITLTKSHLELKIKDILECERNTYAILQGLARQKSETIIGSSLLFISFLWQLINLTLPTTWDDLGSISFWVVCVALLFTFIALVVCHFVTKKIAQRIFNNSL